MEMISITRADALENYKDLLASFCYHIAQLAEINLAVSETEIVSKEIREKVDYLSNRLSFLKEQLLAVKKELGFGGELSFLEDSRFDGFEIKGGCLFGDTYLVDAITKPWLDEFDKTENCYLYEVANYIQFLAHPNCLEEKEEQKKEKKKGILGKILSFVSRRVA